MQNIHVHISIFKTIQFLYSVRQIAQNGQELAAKWINPEYMYCYYAKAFEKYAKKMSRAVQGTDFRCHRKVKVSIYFLYELFTNIYPNLKSHKNILTIIDENKIKPPFLSISSILYYFEISRQFKEIQPPLVQIYKISS